METLSLELSYEWKQVLAANGKPYTYPQPVGHLRDSYSGPTIYRWSVMDGAQRTAVYIGECDNLVARLNGYLNPGSSQANARVKSVFSDHIFQGHIVKLDTLAISSGSIAGKPFGQRDLSDPALRKALENLLARHAGATGVELLNRASNPKDLLSLLEP